MPSQPGSSNWQSQMPAYTPTPNWQPPIPLHPGDAGLCDSNKLDRPGKEQRPSIYIQSPYTPLPPTTELPKKQVGKTKKKSKNDNLSPLNLGNAFAHDNVGGDDIVITGVHDTGIYFSQRTRFLLEDQIKAWMPVINGMSYNQGWGFSIPQQANFKDCGVITYCFIAKLCAGHVPIVPRESESYWENIRYEMGELFYKCRCKNTQNYGYG
ncbi:hypothetical protein Tco_1463773 [Tanacetum coccineum]